MENIAAHSAASQEAMDRLLRAQAQADIAIAQSREQAAALLTAARHQVLDIHRKADLQISTIHKQQAKKIKKRVQEVITLNRLEDANHDGDPQLMARAVALLAARLTGDDKGGR